ncbi:hypothetical protein BDW59DRAFT_181462 [Aspergillus cavernicola]|uniref:TauD/TfdA-like domain-containing protein n=1 Tax=Aspergillus cavernicola TaxID=176166 RepID=A0ABR4IWM6_9EURO
MTPPLNLTNTNPSLITFEPFTLPPTNQRTLTTPHPPHTQIPLALKPSSSSPNPTLETTIQTIQTLQKTNTLTTLLSTHGTLLFRSLPITSATSFSTFTQAFGFHPHEIIGIVVNRPTLAPNVSPANEAPPHIRIYNHNESPQVPHAPGYVFFYCQKAPKGNSGGETPISSSLELFNRVKKEIPGFVEELAEKGILSRVVYKWGKQYEGGSTLREAFGKEILDGEDEETKKQKIEKQIKRYGRGEWTRFEWVDDDHDAEGQSLVVTHQLPVIRTQSGTNLPTLFTGLAAYYRNKLGAAKGGKAERKNVATQLYGDGTDIPEEYLAILARITDEIRVLHKWEEGDVLVFDNVIAQHGREPWEGEQGDRVVLASLYDGECVPGAYGSQGWVQVVKALGG